MLNLIILGISCVIHTQINDIVIRIQSFPVVQQYQEDDLEKEITTHSSIIEASLVAQFVKNLPAMQEIWVQSLGQEESLGQDEPLEKEMATHASILA